MDNQQTEAGRKADTIQAVESKLPMPNDDQASADTSFNWQNHGVTDKFADPPTRKLFRRLRGGGVGGEARRLRSRHCGRRVRQLLRDGGVQVDAAHGGDALVPWSGGVAGLRQTCLRYIYIFFF